LPVYRATIPGRRKPLLIKADNATKASAQLVQLKALTADEMSTALEQGESVWKPGTPLPADDPEPEQAEDEDGEGKTES
jgi:hypothetical protein